MKAKRGRLTSLFVVVIRMSVRVVFQHQAEKLYRELIPEHLPEAGKTRSGKLV